MFNVENTIIEDVKILKPKIFYDNRGYFFESFNINSFEKYISKTSFIQDNESISKYGTLRGIHFQNSPYEQSKLVRVIKGKVQDVAIDLRPNSKTYKKYFSIILDDINKYQLFIPRGCAHAFLTLSKEAIFSDKVDNFYNKNSESGIKFDDPSLNITWELNNQDIILSDKDKELPYL